MKYDETVTVKFSDDGLTARVVGRDTGYKPGVVVARTGRAVVIKWPGRTMRAAVQLRAYMPTSIEAFEVVEGDRHSPVVEAKPLIDWEPSVPYVPSSTRSESGP